MKKEQTQTVSERVAEAARRIDEAKASLERLHEARGTGLLRADASAVASNRETQARVEANLSDLITLQARLEVEAATERLEVERQRKEELGSRLAGADLKARAARAGLRDAVTALSKAVTAARDAADAVNVLRAESGLATSKVDTSENLILGLLVEAGCIDSRALNIPANVLRRLAEDPEEHSRKVEAERRVKEAAAKAYEDSPDTIRRRIANLETRRSSYKADLRSGLLRTVAEKLAKVEEEIQGLTAKLASVGAAA